MVAAEAEVVHALLAGDVQLRVATHACLAAHRTFSGADDVRVVRARQTAVGRDDDVADAVDVAGVFHLEHPVLNVTPLWAMCFSASIMRSLYGRAAATRCWARTMREAAMSSIAFVIFFVDSIDLIRRRRTRSCPPAITWLASLACGLRPGGRDAGAGHARRRAGGACGTFGTVTPLPPVRPCRRPRPPTSPSVTSKLSVNSLTAASRSSPSGRFPSRADVVEDLAVPRADEVEQLGLRSGGRHPRGCRRGSRPCRRRSTSTCSSTGIGELRFCFNSSVSR